MRSIVKTTFKQAKEYVLFFLFLLLSIGYCQAQNNISGQVSATNRKSITGVSVSIKGNDVGTTTDSKGHFSIKAKPNDILVFSSIGYEKREVKVGNRIVLNIVLELANETLDEVVVVGYGSQEKRELTGSISTINLDETQGYTKSNVENMLQGKAAGLLVNSSDGLPGSAPVMRIRGISSINGSNSPLMVIDGIPMTEEPDEGVFEQSGQPSSIARLDPDDIESISVLKDAAATAIYGSRGTNGVIIITTKKGKAGPVKMSYNSSYSIQKNIKRFDLLDATQFAGMANDAYLNAGLDSLYKQSAIDEIGKGTDYQDIVFRPSAPGMNQEATVSGGTQKLSFYSKASYYEQQGIMRKSGFERYSLSSNVWGKLDNGLTYGATLRYTNTINTGAGTQANGANVRSGKGIGALMSALMIRPTVPVTDVDNNLTEGIAIFNPLAQLRGFSQSRNGSQIFGRIHLQYEILPGLSIQSNLGFNKTDNMSRSYRASFLPGSNNGSAKVGEGKYNNLISTNQIDFKKRYGDHQISAVGVAEFQKSDGFTFNVASEDFAFDDFSIYNLGAGANNLIPSSGYFQSRMASFAGRFNYSYKGKYLLSGSGRSDGASRLAEGHKWAFFSAGSLGWIVSDEPFFNRKIINFLKLRGSYGETGNQTSSIYGTLNRIVSQTWRAVLGDPKSGLVGFRQQGMANADLGWEKSQELDLGFDMEVLNSKLNITFDYYRRTSVDLIFNAELPAITGVTLLTTQRNIGRVRNNGVELSVGGNNIQLGKIIWNPSINMSTTKNKILALDGRDEIIPRGYNDGTGAMLHTQVYRVGGSLGAWYGLKTDGLIQEKDVSGSGNAYDIKYNGLDLFPGDRKYVDIDGDDNVTDADRTILGNALPTYFWGFNNSFKWKRLTFSFFIQGSGGNMILNATRAIYLERPTGGFNQYKSVLDRWTPTHTNTSIPRANINEVPLSFNSSWLEKGDYARLKSVTLSYDIPSKFTKLFRGLTVYVSGFNLVTLTKYSGNSPDINAFANQNSAINFQGYDYFTYPSTKQYTAGLNIDF